MLFQTFPVDVFTTYFLFPLVGHAELLGLCVFSWSCKARSSTENLLFAFLSMVPEMFKCRFSPNPTHLGQHYSIHSPSVKVCAPCQWVHTQGLAMGWCVDEVCGVWGACAPLGKDYRWGIPSSSWVALLMEAAKLLVGSVLLWWVISPGCCAPSISQPFSCTDRLNILG